MTSSAPVGIWIAAAAALGVVLGSVALCLRRAPAGRDRRLVGAGLVLWLVVEVLLGAAGAYATGAHRAVPALAFGIGVPILAGLWLLGSSARLRGVIDAIPLPSLIAVQIYRVAGAVFLIAWAAGRLPALFALPAGLGDVAVGLAAPVVARRLADGRPGSHRLAVRWNLAGIADLVVAVTLGALTSPTPLWPEALGQANPLISRLPLVLIPVFAVPLSALLHAVALRRLAPVSEGSSPRTAPRRASRSSTAGPLRRDGTPSRARSR
jgi:hypothetical protein